MKMVPILLAIHPKMGHFATSDLATNIAGDTVLITWISIQEIWFETIKADR
jgi:hypothetical protein